ncbi:hypothetical protein FQA39_LY11164 [Lamprigera yunnana]|nr:hypothetical protein FQA39_LY11164 [Lamprigera yunnana]
MYKHICSNVKRIQYKQLFYLAMLRNKYVHINDVQVDFHDTQNENKVLEITPGPKLLDISYNYVSAQDNANTVVSIAPSKPHDVETSTEANFRNEIEPQAVPDSYTTNVDDSPYVEEPFQDSGSSYAPSEEYGSDSTSDAMEKAPDEEQESSSSYQGGSVDSAIQDNIPQF